MALCPVVLAVLLLQSVPGTAGSAQAAQAQQQPARQQPPQGQAQPQQNTPPDGSGTSPADDPYALARIRKKLGEPPPLASTTANANVPVFRLSVEGYRFQLPTWQQNFVIPPSSVPQPIGGSDYYEMQRLITPPQAWGSAPFSNGDVFGMFQAQLMSGLGHMLIDRALEARRNAASARVRAEVQQELADIEAHNARVAAGQAGAAPDPKAPDKKKQDDKKKDQ